MNNLNRLTNGKLLGAILALAVIPACGPSSDVLAHPELVDKSTHALTIGNILEVNGSYGAGCLSRTGNWSLPLITLSAPTNASLTVAKSNSACVLTLETLRIGVDEASASVYQTAANIGLGASYQGMASAFKVNLTDPVRFYANARIEPNLSFATDFTVRVLYSDDPGAASAIKNADFAAQIGMAATTGVAVPDYTAATTNLTLQVDADYIVQSATGTVDLTDGSILGDTYVVTTTDLSGSPSYDSVDTAFLAGTAAALTGPNPTIPASAFTLGTVNLSSPVKRSLIIAKTDNSASSYEVITVTFNHP